MAKLSSEELAVVAARQKLVELKAKRDADLDSVRIVAEAAISAATVAAANSNLEIAAVYASAELAVNAEIAAAEKAQTAAAARQLSSDSVATLPGLGVMRSKAVQFVRDLQALPQPEDPDESAAFDARLRLAQEAQKRAEDDYAAALAAIHSDHLADLAKG